MVAKYNSSTNSQKNVFRFFTPFRLRLTSKLAKNANMIKKFFYKNAIWISKNTEFYADFESVEKLQTNL
jgi:hypothetical protein